MPHACQSTAFPPLYLLCAGETCPACRQATTVYALVAGAIYDAEDEGTLPGPLILHRIERLPTPTLALLQARCPWWAFDRERPGQPRYLMNHCHRCRAKVTDHYVHGEPGSAFYPCSADECCNISMFALPDSAPVPAIFSHIAGGGLAEWLDYAAAKPLKQ